MRFIPLRFLLAVFLLFKLGTVQAAPLHSCSPDMEQATKDKIFLEFIESANLSEAENCLNNGANINNTNSGHRSALNTIIRNRHKYPGSKRIEALNFLLDKGADVNQSVGNDTTPVHNLGISWTLKDSERKKILQLLVEKGANINAANKAGLTLINEVSRQGDLEDIKLVVQLGASVNQPRLISQAFTNKSPERDAIVKYLVEQGAPLNEPSILAHAVKTNADFLDYLAQKGLNLNQTFPGGQAAYFLAQDLAMLKVFINHIGSLPHTTDRQGKTALFYVQDPESVQFLVKQGFDINHRDNSQITPLIAATTGYKKGCNPALLETLIANGAEVNAKSSFGITALFMDFAPSAPALDCIKVLLNHGADPTVKTTSLKTPLMNRAKYAEEVQYLINHGADPFASDNNNQTLLHYALFASSVDSVKLAVSAGLNPNQKIANESTSRNPYPIFQAALSGNPELVKALLSSPIPVNLFVKNRLGKTVFNMRNSDGVPLHVKFTFQELMKEQGHDPSLLNDKTVKPEIIKILQDYQKSGKRLKSQ